MLGACTELKGSFYLMSAAEKLESEGYLFQLRTIGKDIGIE